ncbi:hypothetical protein BT69DRAFT_1283974 [Atractiella rhizophila]|nr:hypothetical protein BT69DRAFT_1283974 [Atractiella rhizophila]
MQLGIAPILRDFTFYSSKNYMQESSANGEAISATGTRFWSTTVIREIRDNANKSVQKRIRKIEDVPTPTAITTDAKHGPRDSCKRIDEPQTLPYRTDGSS